MWIALFKILLIVLITNVFNKEMRRNKQVPRYWANEVDSLIAIEPVKNERKRGYGR